MDATAIAFLNKQFFSQSEGTNLPPLDELDAMRWIVNTIAIGGSFVAIHKGKIIGGVGLSINPYPWNNKYQFLSNEWFYVLPKYRRYGVAKMLVDAAKMMSDASGRPFIFSLTSGTDRKVARFFAMNGFKPFGDVLSYKLEDIEYEQSIRRENQADITKPSMA